MHARLKQALIQNLAAHPSPWLLALSAGLDSTVLLVAIRELWPGQELKAIHVNHGLQEKAASFEASARALCERFSVDLRVCALTPPASFVDGLEAWARQARYEAIEHVAADLALQRVLLAHHADDQAETFFINLIRGTGIAGLRGMPTVIERGNVVYIRPMLKVDRNILLQQAKDWGLAWDEDPSNGDETFLRNRIRSNLMPLLESIRPGTKQRIVDLMEDLSESTPQTIANVAYLDLGPIQSHSAIEQRDALYRWVKQVALRAPSRARLNVLHELCFVSKLGRGHLKHGDFVFRRIGNRLLAEPRFLA